MEAWHIVVTAFLAGSVMAFQQPARQSMVADTVPRDDLMNAITLNSGLVNGERTVGPAIAGFLIGAVGVGESYLLQAALFLFATVWTFQLDPRLRGSGRGTRGSFAANIADGITYVRSNPIVFGLLVLALVPVLLAQPYQSMAPVFADEVYHLGPAGLGLLLAAPGVGAIIGAFSIAAWGDAARKGMLMLVGIGGFGIGLAALAMSPTLAIALVALGFVGAASTAYRAITQTLLQTHTEDLYRGRVMSMYLLDRGLGPLGAIMAGFLATHAGVRPAVAVLGALTPGRFGGRNSRRPPVAPSPLRPYSL